MSAGVRITTARVWQVGQLARILSDCVDEAPWLPCARTAREEVHILRDLVRRDWVRVAKRDGHIVGFIALGDGEVHGLYLRRDLRGRGIAQALMAHAQTEAPKLGLWAHAANHPARRFYTAQGFRPVRFGNGNDERLTEIRFEWERAV